MPVLIWSTSTDRRDCRRMVRAGPHDVSLEDPPIHIITKSPLGC